MSRKLPTEQANYYRIPDKFPNVIKFLDSVKTTLPYGTISGRLLVVDEETVFVSSKGIFILERAGTCRDIVGVGVDNRFSVYVWTALAAMRVLHPKHHAEIEAFREWINEEDNALSKKRMKDNLMALANRLGYKVVKDESKKAKR